MAIALPFSVTSERGAIVSTGAVIGSPRLRDMPLRPALQTSGAAGRGERESSAAECLAEAVATGDEAETMRLLDLGASVHDAPDRGLHRDVTPLALAARGSRPASLLHLLLQRGAVAAPATTLRSQQTEDRLISAAAPADMPPLGDRGINAALQAWTTAYVDSAAHEAEALAKLHLLITFGADVNAAAEHTGETPLHLAAKGFQKYRVEGVGSHKNRYTSRRMESSAFKVAALLRAKADPTIRDRNYRTAFDNVSTVLRQELLRTAEQLTWTLS
eukprot:TRINITY_DN47327_c0_g1_i1.p1 TRINITY_DN47327_c0_g1~~TRINITY_DN47327_c0_g1_i1.p1  ORF type:complete len:291 (-),score=66.79 TRINITY_DN47327_c0_g1_i1:106-927(-)